MALDDPSPPGVTMSWLDLETAAPSIAARGRELVTRGGKGSGLLATVAGTDLPRLHPVTVGFVDGRLLVFMIEGSPKARDLAQDGRYAFHAHLDPVVPREFVVRGHARAVTDAELRERAV